MTFTNHKVNMALLKFMFTLFCCFCLVNSELNTENTQNSYETYGPQVIAVLNYLNSSPVKVYNYKEANVVNAHKKADIIELTLDVNIDCINNYPELPCTEKTLTCSAFIQDIPNEESKVLGDVHCNPKVESTTVLPTITSNIPEIEVPEETISEVKQSITLSNEATSTEVDDHFVAVRRDSVPCLGCPFDLNSDAEGVDELIHIALRHVESERTNRHSLVKVLKLQQQVVSGVKYILTAEIAPTTCRKELQLESCPLDVNSNTLTCEVTFLEMPWIDKVKHVIGNNCTQSQEFVLPVNDMSNEIDVTGGRNKPGKAAFIPNFDRIAESGAVDEMTAARLEDLESQILFAEPTQPNIGPKTETGIEQKPTTEDDVPIIDEFIVPSTAESEVFEPIFSQTPLINFENQPLEDKPTAEVIYASQEPIVIISEESYTTPEKLPEEVIDFLATPSEQIQYDAPDTTLSTTTQQPEENKLSSSEVEKKFDSTNEEKKTDSSDEEKKTDSSDEEKKPDSNESSEETNSEHKAEIQSAQKSSSDSESDSKSSSEETTRTKRAIRQLEKVSPEEKGLVKRLADFAALALDDIDDDNHKRLVLQTLGSKKMVTEDGIYYHLILRMGVSRCLEDNVPESNVNCRGNLFENYTKICKVQVHVDNEYSNPKMVKSQCQNIKRDKNDSNRTNYSRFKRDILLGGKKEIDKNNAKIQDFLGQSLAFLDSQTGYTSRYKPVEIISATSQQVAGTLYRIRANISLSDCLQNEDKEIESCNFLEEPSWKICEIKIWERLWLHSKEATVKCEDDDKEYKFDLNDSNVRRRRRSVPGGPEEIDKNSSDVKQFIKESLNHLDSESGHPNRHKSTEVLSATSQVVAGILYKIKAKISLTDCPKGGQNDLESCKVLDDTPSKLCSIEVWERRWLNKREITIKCDNEPKKHKFEVTIAKRKRAVEDLSENENLLEDYNLESYLEFMQFINKHKKSYITPKEFIFRYKVFRKNMDYVRLLNLHEQGTAKYGATQFADLTREEFSKIHGLRWDLHNENEIAFPQAKIPDIKLPKEFDWRKLGAVAEVKNQEQCGSCWAFSVTGNVEGQYAIKHGKLLEFSEQELVDCDTEDQGCNGGLMDTAYRVIEKLGGLETEQDYPYDAEDEKCHFNKSLVRAQLTGALNISQNETDMAKWLVKNGPISIAINANAMQFYMGGVSHPLKFLCNPNNLDHGVLIVGYGVHEYPLFKKSLPYWIVKNSWGTSWGEQGYYRVYRGDGTCGLNQTPSSAIVA